MYTDQPGYPGATYTAPRLRTHSFDALIPFQIPLDLPGTLGDLRRPAVADAVARLAAESTDAARGAVFTRIEVAEFILDLIGYTADRPLHRLRLLEPSFGAGDFLLPAIERLLRAWRRDGARLPVTALESSITAVELHRDTFEASRSAVLQRLDSAGCDLTDAQFLADRWLRQDDFLLHPIDGGFDFVVGNPPYVRQELIPPALLSEYRARYATVFDRADLYVPFIERGLMLLGTGGTLGYICADRWTKNRYGAPLRQLIARDFHLRFHIDMVDTDAFRAEVSAYPAITVITRAAPGPTRIAHRPAIDRTTLTSLAVSLRGEARTDTPAAVREVARVPDGAEPWLLDSADHLELLRRLETKFPSIEAAGCKVGIGVATGADKAFIAAFDQLDVEEDRKLPLAMTRDIKSGEIAWRGLGVINPFDDAGGLVDLNRYPRLARFLEARRDVIARRHCARRAPTAWYRTIDRIWPALARTPKLLIPDIKGHAHIVLDDGWLYPHHNLYYMTSTQWDLRALQAVLMSEVARLIIASYSTRMRGGYLRFQAQYLRRLRLPNWADVPTDLRAELTEAALARDLDRCNAAAFALYGLTDDERETLGAARS